MEFLSSFYKNSTAIITENNEYISYQKLYEYVDKFSNIIKKRYLVFLVCKNNLESIVGYLSFIKSDCVISLIDEKIPEKYFNKLIKDYRPEYIFFEKNRIKKLDNFTSIYNFYSYELLKSKKITKKKIHDDLSLLISTSGTTGTSKFVRQSKVNIQNNTKVISKYLST